MQRLAYCDGERRRVSIPPMYRRSALAAIALATSCALACPVDTEPRARDVLLTLQTAEGRTAMSWRAAQLRALGVATWTERRSIDRSGGDATEQTTIVYDGVRLRDVIGASGGDPALDRALRGAVFEAIASDGYRAVFSWGELFNSSAGERTIVVLAFNGQPLDARQGPLALRALGDTRLGPRHVRNLSRCAFARCRSTASR